MAGSLQATNLTQPSLMLIPEWQQWTTGSSMPAVHWSDGHSYSFTLRLVELQHAPEVLEADPT
eukprot:CAMPEP_0185198680 /NCGR_PEP_ID=MMETSP1140-20130426/43460_1 /TAXON_ID=298111 /ORGANISM="Pavlova sp., Strain CCMP459" /LENGTH=62 /DNA_ID=CAMNT_0027765899 /DNA_START=186 /DNA_END=370 /DNA_ORIENTATION=-